MGANPPKAAPREAPTRKKAAVERRMLGAVAVTDNAKLVQHLAQYKDQASSRMSWREESDDDRSAKSRDHSDKRDHKRI